jgi:hypothetical protein
LFDTQQAGTGTARIDPLVGLGSGQDAVMMPSTLRIIAAPPSISKGVTTKAWNGVAKTPAVTSNVADMIAIALTANKARLAFLSNSDISHLPRVW